MGSDKQTSQTHATSETNPYAVTIPGINGIVNQINGMLPGAGSLNPVQQQSLDQLQANAAQGNPYASSIGNIASTLLNGGGPDRTGIVNSSYNTLQNQLTPFANGSMVGQNSGLLPYLNTLRDDAINSIGGMFSGAGRDPSGNAAAPQAIARGFAQGAAPVVAQQFNTDTQNQLNAINALYSGGNTTAGLLSGLDQTKLANQQAGIGAASQALSARDAPLVQQLAIQAQRTGIPSQQLAQLEGLIVPLAQLGGTSTADSTTTSTRQSDPTRAIIGGAIGGLGLLSGNPMGLFGGGSSLLGGFGWGGTPGGTGGILGGLY